MPETPPSELAGRIVADRYRLERRIGRGGMGTVWAARHLSLKKLVAIKFIHDKLASSEEALRRFDLEAKAAAKLKSRHAVAVYDHGITDDGQPYIVMEYLEGETLEHTIRRRGALGLPEVTAIVSQAARALDAAHEAGIIHRDLKPDNIFLARDSEAGKLGYTVKLVDFGIAKMVHDEAATGAAATQAGVVLGTPHFMSPETLMATAPVSAASDVWSLGACAFAALLGRVPFEGDAIGNVVLKVCAQPLPIPSQIDPRVPAGFDQWFAKACHRNPAERFGSAREMAIALQQLEQWALAQRETTAYEIRAAPGAALLDSLPPPGPNRGTVIAAALAGMAVVTGLGAFYVFSLKKEASEKIYETAASAAAAVEAQNERKLRESEKYVFGDADAGPDAAASPKQKPNKKPPRR